MGGARVVDGARAPALAHARAAEAALRVVGLRTEYKENPLGIDTRKPRLSWRLESQARGVVQSAYEIRVTGGDRGPGKIVWTSGKVASDDSIQRVYEGPALRSGGKYEWQVRVWDGGGRVSAWSAPSSWEMGLLEPSDWKASWIEPGLPEDAAKSGPSPMLRREFRVKGGVARARAYVTSHGLYEMYLNGRRVGDELFTPGWTSYNKRLQYQTYDVTALLQAGANAVGVQLGNGWYRGDLAWEGRRNIYGDRLGLLLQIRVTYKDGSEELVTSDGQWKASTGPVLMSEIYHGETYDARLEKAGWSSPGFDDKGWTAVREAAGSKEILIAPEGPPVRRIQELKPAKVIKTPAGETVVDMGQNMVGWARLKVQGPAGTTVTLRHAEVLDKDGNFYTANLRKAKATLQYTLKGGGAETFEPHFTFFGFRYVAVAGFPGELTHGRADGDRRPLGDAADGRARDLEAAPQPAPAQHPVGPEGQLPRRSHRLPAARRAAGMDRRRRGLLSDGRLQHGRGGLFHEVAEGRRCRSVLERLGTPRGAERAARLRGPRCRRSGGLGRRGDDHPVEHVPGLRRQARAREPVREHVALGRLPEDAGRGRPIWDGDFHFGDWLAFASAGMAANDYPGATTGKDFIATAYFARSTDLLQRAAKVLGKKEDAARYADQLAKIKAAFRREFVTEAGRVGEGTQTAYALALQFDLLPEELRAAAARRLAEDVRTRKHLTTGFLGTPPLCHVLSRYGYLDEAYLLLNREEYPSWLYPVKQGATTIWERWDGQKPDGSFQDGRDELVQPLRLRRDRGLDVPRDGRHRDGRGGARLQARPDPAAARRRIRERQGEPRDALRKGRVGVDARRRALRASGRGAAQHEGDGAAAEGAARQRDGRGQARSATATASAADGRTATTPSSKWARAGTGFPTWRRDERIDRPSGDSRRPRARGARQPRPADHPERRRSPGGRLRQASERGEAARLVALDERQHHQGRASSSISSGCTASASAASRTSTRRSSPIRSSRSGWST